MAETSANTIRTGDDKQQEQPVQLRQQSVEMTSLVRYEHSFDLLLLQWWQIVRCIIHNSTALAIEIDKCTREAEVQRERGVTERGVINK